MLNRGSSHYSVSPYNLHNQIWELSFREKSKRSQNGQKIIFEYSEGHNFIFKKLFEATHAGKFLKSFYSRKTKGSIQRRIFRKNEKKVKKIGQTFNPQTFSKAVDKGFKWKETLESTQAHKGEKSFSIDTPLSKISRSFWQILKIFQ